MNMLLHKTLLDAILKCFIAFRRLLDAMFRCSYDISPVDFPWHGASHCLF